MFVKVIFKIIFGKLLQDLYFQLIIAYQSTNNYHVTFMINIRNSCNYFAIEDTY